MSHQVNLSFQLLPVNSPDSYAIIDKAIDVIQQSGIKYEVQPFSTVMEGELHEIWEIILQAKEAAIAAGAGELLLNLQIHLKAASSVSFEEKTAKFRH